MYNISRRRKDASTAAPISNMQEGIAVIGSDNESYLQPVTENSTSAGYEKTNSRLRPPSDDVGHYESIKSHKRDYLTVLAS